MPWRPILESRVRPRHWRSEAAGFYYYDLIGTATGEPIGYRKLKRLRTARERADACDDFAALVATHLPAAAVWTYMPSSTRRSCGSVPDAIEPTFRRALERRRPDLRFSEPIIRARPIESVHESRDRDVDRLTSTLAPSDNPALLSGDFFVVDNFINTGATFEAFRRALERNEIAATPVLLAMVLTGGATRWH